MKCLVCEQETDRVRLRELPQKIPKKLVEEAMRLRVSPQPIPSELLEHDEIATRVPSCDRCDENVRSGAIVGDEIALRALTSERGRNWYLKLFL